MCICKYPFSEMSTIYSKINKLQYASKASSKDSSTSGSEREVKSGYKNASKTGHSVNNKTETETHIPKAQSTAKPTKPFGFFKNTEFFQNKT